MARDESGDRLSATILSRRFAGAQFVYRVRLDSDLVLDFASRDRIDPGQVVGVRVTHSVPMVP
jgi:hypothetical protein